MRLCPLPERTCWEQPWCVVPSGSPHTIGRNKPTYRDRVACLGCPVAARLGPRPVFHARQCRQHASGARLWEEREEGWVSSGCSPEAEPFCPPVLSQPQAVPARICLGGPMNT